MEGTKKYDPKIMLARFEKHGFGRGGLLTWGIIAWSPCMEIQLEFSSVSLAFTCVRLVLICVQLVVNVFALVLLVSNSVH